MKEELHNCAAPDATVDPAEGRPGGIRPAATQARPPSVWSYRDTWLILPGRTLATAAHAAAMVCLILRVHDQGHGPWAVAALLGCVAAPAVLAMGWAGGLADRGDSRRLLVVGLAVQAGAAVGLAMDDRLVSTYLLVVVFELGQAVVGPVWTGLLPRVVGEANIASVVAWQQGLGAVAGPAGAAVAGVVYQSAGAAAVLWAMAATTLVLAAVSLGIRTRRHLAIERPETASTGHRLEGLRHLRGEALLGPLVIGLLVMVVLVEGVNAAEVFLARDELGASPSQYGLVELVSGLGGVLGAVGAARLATDRRRIVACTAGFGGCGLAIAGAGMIGSFSAYLVLMVGVTAAAAVGNAATGALIIGRTADADRGKVQAGLNGLARAGTVVALAAGGSAVTVAGPRPVFIVGGLAGAAVMAVTWVRLGTVER